MTFRAPRRRFAHPKRGQPYYEVNSRRGVARAARDGYRWIDLDCHTTEDNVLVITHYPLPLRHGFEDPQGKIRATTPIWELAWKQVRRLVAHPGRYKINRAKSLIRYALRRGLNVELELKDRYITQQQLVGLWKYLIEVGLDPKRVQVKVGIWIPGHLALLQRAHAAGFTTILLIHRGDPRRVPHKASAFIDYYRGKAPRWF